MCVLPNVWLVFLQNVVFYQLARGAPLCRRPSVSEPGTGPIFSVFWASVFAEFLYVFFVLVCLGGGPKGRHF